MSNYNTDAEHIAGINDDEFGPDVADGDKSFDSTGFNMQSLESNSTLSEGAAPDEGLWDSVKDYDYEGAAGDYIGGAAADYIGGGGSGGGGGGMGGYSVSGESSMERGDVQTSSGTVGATFGNIGYQPETSHFAIAGGVLVLAIILLKKL